MHRDLDVPKINNNGIFKTNSMSLAPMGITLKRPHRPRNGMANSLDLREDNDAFYAAFIFCMKHSLLFYLSVTKQVDLLRKIFWVLENKNLLQGIKRSYKKFLRNRNDHSLSHQRPIQKTSEPLEDELSSLHYPFDLEDYTSLPAFIEYSLLNTQYHQLYVLYGQAQATIFYDSFRIELSILEVILKDQALNPSVRASAMLLYQAWTLGLPLYKIDYQDFLPPDELADLAALDKKIHSLQNQGEAATSKMRSFLSTHSLPKKYKEQLEKNIREKTELLEKTNSDHLPSISQKLKQIDIHHRYAMNLIDSKIEAFRKSLSITLKTNKGHSKQAIQTCLDKLTAIQKDLSYLSARFDCFHKKLKNYQSVLKTAKSVFEIHPKWPSFFQPSEALKTSHPKNTQQQEENNPTVIHNYHPLGFFSRELQQAFPKEEKAEEKATDLNIWDQSFKK